MTSPPTRSRLPAALAAAALALARAAQADNSLAYEYENYQESGGRIDVRTQGAQADQDLGTDLHLEVGGVVDAIAGATPTGQPAPAGSDQVVLAELHDRRKAWNTSFSDQLPQVNVSVGFARSLEHDYVSNGWSVNTLTTFNQKNTTLLLGASGTDDNVEVFFLPEWLKKRGTNVIAGLTQLLDPLTSVTLDVTGARATGMLNEPYKLVQKDIEVLPGVFLPETFSENRPDARNRLTALLSLERAFPAAHGSVEARYRYYQDTYGIAANTLEADWFQKIGSRVILQPLGRVYEQSAAHFYYYDLDGTAIVPTRIPDPGDPNYSSDARLSAFTSVDYGLKAVVTVADWLQVSAEVERYSQRGTDGITPQSAYYRASITSLAGKFSW